MEPTGCYLCVNQLHSRYENGCFRPLLMRLCSVSGRPAPPLSSSLLEEGPFQSLIGE